MVDFYSNEKRHYTKSTYSFANNVGLYKTAKLQ